MSRCSKRFHLVVLVGALGFHIRLQPDYGEAFCSRGNARQDKGDLEGAIADYNEAIRLQPDDAINFCNRGIARKAKGDLEGAMADFEQAARLKSAAGA